MNKKLPISTTAAAVATIATAATTAATALATRTLLETIVNGPRQTLDEALKWQSDHYDISFIDGLSRTTYTVKSFDGYELHAEYFANPAPSDRYVLISHGLTDNRYGDLKYMKIYLDLGYNCVTYDLRGHGENAPTPCTYSIRESADLSVMITDTYERYGQDITLGLHGESLGAASTIGALGKTQRVAFAVADCPFGEIESVLRGVMTARHFPRFLVTLAGALADRKYGFTFKDCTPMEVLPANRVPILFIHGENDSLISPDHSRKMANMTAGYTEVHIIPGAEHAQSVLAAPDTYAEILTHFLGRVF